MSKRKAKTRTTLTVEFDGGFKEISKIMNLLEGKMHGVSVNIRTISSIKDEFDEFPDEEADEGKVSMRADKFLNFLGRVQDAARNKDPNVTGADITRWFNEAADDQDEAY